jgi:hypothetical protein
VRRESRLYVRLELEDWRLLRERSRTRGLAAATYVSLLVRTHLRGGAPLPKAEFLALRQCITEVTTIGRNLNQIARRSNQNDRLGRSEVVAMIKVAEALRGHFKALLEANCRSWRDGDAGTSD